MVTPALFLLHHCRSNLLSDVRSRSSDVFEAAWREPAVLVQRQQPNFFDRHDCCKCCWQQHLLAKKQPAAFTSVFVRHADEVRESTKSTDQHGAHTGTTPRATAADHWEAAACGMFAAAFSVSRVVTGLDLSKIKIARAGRGSC